MRGGSCAYTNKGASGTMLRWDAKAMEEERKRQMMRGDFELSGDDESVVSDDGGGAKFTRESAKLDIHSCQNPGWISRFFALNDTNVCTNLHIIARGPSCSGARRESATFFCLSCQSCDMGATPQWLTCETFSPAPRGLDHDPGGLGGRKAAQEHHGGGAAATAAVFTISRSVCHATTGASPPQLPSSPSTTGCAPRQGRRQQPRRSAAGHLEAAEQRLGLWRWRRRHLLLCPETS